MGSELQSILARIERTDQATAKELRRHFDMLAKRREFGLNFERHTPERVGLPGRPISIGDKVMFVAPRGETKVESKDAWIVESFQGEGTGRVAHLRNQETGDRTERLVEDLVFAADFRDPIFPGLASVERIERGDGPFHAVINGENFHVVDALRYTHTGKVDLIYIDPPYNTGNEGWIYNDRYVSSEDGGKHSMWLAFMERRLKVARRLLKETGVIIVAIGDDEHHRLRMLMDQVFGDQNFIMNATWQGGGSALARHHAGGVDYMLIYGRNAEQVDKFLDPKPFVPEMLRIVNEALSGGSTREEAQEALRAFIKENVKNMPEGVTRFNNVDDAGRIYETADLTNRLPRPNLRYPVTDPETGTVYDPPENGWTVRRQVMDEWIAAGLIAFGRRPRKKKSLVDYAVNMPVPSFTHSRNTANAHLEKILGAKRFPFPKDHEVLMRWIRMAAPQNAVILDFFGGSGTTAEAVMRLNAEDGGTRQCILVTNNEVAANDAKALAKDGYRDGDPEWEAKGVFEYVTRPRISTVVTGIRPDGSNYSEGLETNVEFFNLTYENPALVEMDLAFERVAPLLWLKAGGEGRRIDAPTDDFAIAETYAVLFNPDATAPFLKALRGIEAVRVVYVVTDDEPQFQAVDRQLPDGIESVRLYSSYLHAFKINTGAAGE